MLLATTVMLLVFRSPSATISVMWLISAKMFVNEKPPFPLRKFHSIANLCATLNAATTFIMFIIYGTKFRSEFTRIYCCCLCKMALRKRQKRRTVIIVPPEQQQLSNEPLKEVNRDSQSMQTSSSTTTTRTTNASLVSVRYQRSSSVREDNGMTRTSECQITIREDEDESKSVTLTVSYTDCLKNFLSCR